MLRKEQSARREAFGQFNLLTFRRPKYLVDEVVLAGFELLGQHDARIVGQREQMAVKCLIMNGGEAQAVTRVKSVRLVGAPCNDVAGNQQTRVADTGDTATATIAGEHGTTEKGLLDALLNHCTTRLAGEIGELEVIDRIAYGLFLYPVFLQKLLPDLLTFEGKRFPIGMELIPHLFVERRGIA